MCYLESTTTDKGGTTITYTVRDISDGVIILEGMTSSLEGKLSVYDPSNEVTNIRTKGFYEDILKHYELFKTGNQ